MHPISINLLCERIVAGSQHNHKSSICPPQYICSLKRKDIHKNEKKKKGWKWLSEKEQGRFYLFNLKSKK